MDKFDKLLPYIDVLAQPDIMDALLPHANALLPYTGKL